MQSVKKITANPLEVTRQVIDNFCESPPQVSKCVEINLFPFDWFHFKNLIEWHYMHISKKKIVSLFRSFCLSLYKRKFSSQEVLVRLRSQLYHVTEFLLFKVNLQSQWDHGRVSSRFFWRDEDYRKTQQTERPLQTRTDYLHLRYRDVILGTKIGSD